MIPGETAEEMRSRVGGELSRRHRPAWRTLGIFSVGLNDSVLLPNNNERVDLDDFKLSVVGIADAMRNIIHPNADPTSAPTVAYIGYTAFDEERAVAIPLFRQSLADPEFIKKGISKDGLHPSEYGHQWMYERIASKIDELVA